MRAWMRRERRWSSVVAAAAALAAWGLPEPSYAQSGPEHEADGSRDAEAVHEAVETEPPAPAAADVARELYRLQQARGGSIVPDWSELERPASPQDAPRPAWSPHRPVAVEAAPIYPTQQGPAGPPSEGRPGEGPAPLRAPAPLPAPPGTYGPPGTPLYAPPTAPSYGPFGAPRPAPVERPAPSRIDALRDTAAHLDQAANRLEGLELYEQADRLRETAQQLRLAARETHEREMHEREMHEREMHEREMHEREMRDREMHEREMRERG
jgi:hypothetical protein